jgi:mannose-6-phosphate isomerase
VKWLFTSERLSIQVHPDDIQGRAHGFVSGKEECWVVVAAEPGAVLGIGTRVALDAETLRRASLNGEIESVMDWKPVSAGDYFYIPAGTVHAIGAGVTLVEVQQNADVTYRLYDYGRPRELHLDAGIAVSRARPYADLRAGRLSPSASQYLVEGPHFDLWHLRADAIADWTTRLAGLWVIPLTGRVQAAGTEAIVGECLYLPDRTALAASDDASVLIAAARAV